MVCLFVFTTWKLWSDAIPANRAADELTPVKNNGKITINIKSFKETHIQTSQCVLQTTNGNIKRISTLYAY